MTRLATMRANAERSAGRKLEDYPVRLFAEHMAEIFGVSVKQVYALDAAGAFDFAAAQLVIGRKSWSRDRVAQYFAGTLEARDVRAARRLRRVS